MSVYWRNSIVVKLFVNAVILLCIFKGVTVLWSSYRGFDSRTVQNIDLRSADHFNSHRHVLLDNAGSTDLKTDKELLQHGLVNCTGIQDISPARVGWMKGPPSYPVSYAWWVEPGREKHLYPGEVAIQEVRRLLRETPEGEMLLDVGANVGYAAMYGAVFGRPVIAVEPISYNVAKLCEGWRVNGEVQNLKIFHAAAGAGHNISVQITRPVDSVGHFDQSSLSRGAVDHDKTTTETIPLIRLDGVVPPDMPVGVVKIDVQGHELMVLQGMTGLLSREHGSPRHILYEAHAPSERAAGVKPGAARQLLESFGYHCKGCCETDMLCSKKR